MRSASRQTLATTINTLTTVKVGPATAADLFAASRAIAGSSGLLSTLTDSTLSAKDRAGLAKEVFDGKIDGAALGILSEAVLGRWSEHEDLLDGLDELAVRAAALSTGEAKLTAELFAFRQAVSSNAELELALRSKLARPEAKADLATEVLANASADTREIVRSLILQPRGRRLRDGLKRAAEVVADQAGKLVATITSSRKLDDAHVEKLAKMLQQRYGRPVTCNLQIDPAVLGGVRIAILSDVIDGSVATRLSDVKQRLVG